MRRLSLINEVSGCLFLPCQFLDMLWLRHR